MMDKTVRLGFIGCGGNSRGHGRSIIGIEGTEIVGLTDVSLSLIHISEHTRPERI